MKKATLIAMLLVLMLFLLSSCAAGVSQQEYDKVKSDLATAQTQIQSLQADLSAKESELQDIKGKLEQGKARIEILNAIFIHGLLITRTIVIVLRNQTNLIRLKARR